MRKAAGAIKDLLAQTTLSVRVFFALVASGLLAVIFTLMISLQHEIISAEKDMEHQRVLNNHALPSMIRDSAARGDYASIKQIFENELRESSISRIRLSGESDELIAVAHEPLLVAPAWFAQYLNLKNIACSAVVEDGDKRYGLIEFEIDSIKAVNNIWQGIVYLALALAMAMTMAMTFVLLIIKPSLRQVNALAKAAEGLNSGLLQSLPVPKGTPELRDLTRAFNRMATATREANKMLTLERDRFKQLTKLSVDWYWEQDAEYRFTFISSGLAAASMQTEQCLGKTRWELPLNLSEKAIAEHRAKLEGHEPFTIEYGVQTPIAGLRWFLVKGEPIFNNEVFIGYRGVGSDITQTKLVSERQILAASVFQRSHNGIVIANAEGLIIDVNPSFERITGYSRHDLTGKNPSILKSGRQSPEFYAEMWGALKERGYWSGELWNRRSDGEIYAVAWSISVVNDEAGSVSHLVGISSDITVIKDHQRHIEVVAAQDPLTQLPNRAKLHENLKMALLVAERSNDMVAVCYIDLDGFKPINEHYGHAIGDQILIGVAQQLKNCVRENDTVARLGGDEFVVLLTGMESRRECKKTVSRMLDVIAAPHSIGEHGTATITASIGVVLYPQDDGDADALLRHADQSMYQAKQEGKNRFHLFDPASNRETHERSMLLTRFAKAIDQGEALLFYQPKVELLTGEVIGLEALARWQHPETGMIPPGEFLPLVEGSPVAIRFGYWVIERALQQICAWQLDGMYLKVSVNIPGQLLLHENFPKRVKALLAKYPEVTGAMLEMEILESVALENIARAADSIRECKQMGITFALDDFGTGYSSLTYLKRLDINWLKIDQSFIRNMNTDTEDLAIVEGVIGLAEAFNRTALAEGIETVEIGTTLIRLGCRFGQGYCIARPMPPEAVINWVETWQLPPEWKSSGRCARDNIPLLAAEVYHRQWVQNIQTVVAGQEVLHEVSVTGEQCPFGKWLMSSKANRFREQKHFHEVARLHREIHKTGSVILDFVDDGHIELAKIELSNLLERRDRLIELLHQMAQTNSRTMAGDLDVDDPLDYMVEDEILNSSRRSDCISGNDFKYN